MYSAITGCLSRAGSSVMKIGWNLSAVAPKSFNAPPIWVSVVGQTSGQKV